MQKIFSLLLISLFSVITLTAYAADASPTFAITSPAFLDQGALPVLYACDGKNISPEFDWTAAPKKQKRLL